MATSGVTAWSLTARDIITASLHELGVLGINREPKAGEAERCMLRLNGLLKSWQGSETAQTTATVSIPANTASVTLTAAVEDVVGARLVSSGDERPLLPAMRDRYLTLPDKTQRGDPIMFYTSEQAAGVEFYVWPVPTAITSIAIDYIRKPETVTDLGQTVDIPERYQEALIANLAVRCAGLFGAQVPQELYQRAAMLRREMEDAERPASYFLQGRSNA